jgi:tRNA 2-selenouridine synthase
MSSQHPAPFRVGLDRLGDFDAVIDVRSPAEFRDDHIPGAINCPVLDDAQRAQIGTLYKQVSPFEARKLGAALVSRNIARHLESEFYAHAKNWKPLIYCWRGGQRSAAMTLVLGQVGWAARQLEGGYKAFRHQVLADLDTLPAPLGFRVLCGPTGSGKTALLLELARQGAQVLDLEALAVHRGSALGADVKLAQPGQKAFETALWQQLAAFDPARPVWAESESRQVGKLHVPVALFAQLTGAECLRIHASPEARVSHLLTAYADLIADRAEFCARLARLIPLHGHVRIGEWQALVEEGAWDALAHRLIVEHYDPAYRRGGDSLYRRREQGPELELPSLDATALARVAQTLL